MIPDWTFTATVPGWLPTAYLVGTLFGAAFFLGGLVSDIRRNRQAPVFWKIPLWPIVAVSVGLTWPVLLRDAVREVRGAISDYRSGLPTHGWRTIVAWTCPTCRSRCEARPLPEWLPTRFVSWLGRRQIRRDHRCFTWREDDDE